MITKFTKSLTIAIMVLFAISSDSMAVVSNTSIVSDTSPANEKEKNKDYYGRNVKLNITNKTKDVPGHVNEHTIVVIQGPTYYGKGIMSAKAVATDTPNREAQQPKQLEMAATPKYPNEFNMPITVLIDNRKELGISNTILAFHVANIQNHAITMIQPRIQTDNIMITTKITENVLGMIVVNLEITDDVE
jgi:hypothetical protein